MKALVVYGSVFGNVVGSPTRGFRPTEGITAFLEALSEGPLKQGELERAVGWGRQCAGIR